MKTLKNHRRGRPAGGYSRAAKEIPDASLIVVIFIDDMLNPPVGHWRNGPLMVQRPPRPGPNVGFGCSYMHKLHSPLTQLQKWLFHAHFAAFGARAAPGGRASAGKLSQGAAEPNMSAGRQQATRRRAPGERLRGPPQPAAARAAPERQRCWLLPVSLQVVTGVLASLAASTHSHTHTRARLI